MALDRSRSLGWLLACTGAMASSAVAQQPLHAPAPAPAPAPARNSVYAPRSGVHTHDGFMARLTGGFGTGVTSASGQDLVGPLEREQDGFSGSLALDLGGALAQNLVLHGRLANASIVSPEGDANPSIASSRRVRRE